MHILLYGIPWNMVWMPYSVLLNTVWMENGIRLEMIEMPYGVFCGILYIQIPTEVLSHPVVEQEISNNLNYDHSILFKIVLFESLNTQGQLSCANWAGATMKK